MLNQKVKLRAGSQYIIPKIQTVRADTGRVLVCEIEDLEIPSGATATFWAMKPSGKSVQNDALISGQEVIVELTNQTLAEQGYVKCQIEIESDGDSVKTFEFLLDNGISLAGDWPKSENENTYLEGVVAEMQAKLTETINQSQAATSSANTAVQSANTATANANAAADEARQTIWNNKNLTNSTSASESQVETAAGAAVLTGVDGKTEQKATTGANLLNLRNGKSGTGEGVTYTRNNDGSYSVRGTATGINGNVWFLGNFGQDPSIEENVVFTLKPGNYKVKDCILFRNQESFKSEFTIQSELKITGVRNPSQETGVTYSKTIYPMITLGSDDVPWEPYTGEIPAPNPDYTIPVQGVGGKTGDESFKFNAIIQSNQLFDASILGSYTARGVTFTNNKDGSYLVNGQATDYASINRVITDKLIPGKKYICSGGKENVLVFLRKINPDGSFITFKDTPMLFAGDEYQIAIYVQVNKGETADNVIVWPMINEGEFALPFESYFRSDIPVTINQPLFEGDKLIQVKAGQKYVGEDGVKHTEDRDLWGIYRTTVMYKFNGEESWYSNSTNKPDELRFLLEMKKQVKISDKSQTSNIHSFNTSFPLGVQGSTYSDYNRYTLNNNPVGGKSTLYVRKDADTTLDTFKQYLAENPMYLVAELETPYFEPFADQTPFLKWYTPDGGCTITTDDHLKPIISADTAQTPEGSYLLTGYIDGLNARNNETIINALSDQALALTQKSMEG